MTFTCLIFVLSCMSPQEGGARMDEGDTVPVCRTEDFTLDGSGGDAHWQQASWHSMRQIDRGATPYTSRFKILYSAGGIYVLFQGTDTRITTSYTNDFEDLYNGDVFEVFFHPQPSTPLYFEYEINQIGNELVLLVPNLKGHFRGWRPWHYEGDRCVVKRVCVEGGPAEAGAAIGSWSAELFIPFALLTPLENVPPSPGDAWKANFCRLDYDTGSMIKWSWSPIQTSFHEFQVYRTIRFQ
jgi:hypothetical protein